MTSEEVKAKKQEEIKAKMQEGFAKIQPKVALNKGVEQGKKEMLEKAIKWLEEHGKDYWWDVTEQSVEDFRKAMGE